MNSSRSPNEKTSKEDRVFPRRSIFIVRASKLVAAGNLYLDLVRNHFTVLHLLHDFGRDHFANEALALNDLFGRDILAHLDGVLFLNRNRLANRHEVGFADLLRAANGLLATRSAVHDS